MCYASALRLRPVDLTNLREASPRTRYRSG